MAPVLALCFTLSPGDSQPGQAGSKKAAELSPLGWLCGQAQPAWPRVKPVAIPLSGKDAMLGGMVLFPRDVPIFLSITAQKRGPKGER